MKKSILYYPLARVCTQEGAQSGHACLSQKYQNVFQKREKKKKKKKQSYSFL